MNSSRFCHESEHLRPTAFGVSKRPSRTFYHQAFAITIKKKLNPEFKAQEEARYQAQLERMTRRDAGTRDRFAKLRSIVAEAMKASMKTASAKTPHLLLRGGFRLTLQGGGQRMPSQSRALHADRILFHPL